MTEDLRDFTDILDDEICDSQPISLPSSNNSDTEVVSYKTSPKSNRPPKLTGQKGIFRSIEEIDPKYRHIFSYQYFNLVQSRVIEDALYSDKSIVVSAPTGSGKTVIFEMAIVQLLMDLEDKNYMDDFKIIYMAPVKALCTERLTEWYPKFTKLGHLCKEVTGDTNVEFPELKPYRIIITTPEKWDVLTRRWKDHRSLVEVVKLFLIDEVHILNDEARGPVLEAVVSRMKTIESSVQSTHRIEQLLAQYKGTEAPANAAKQHSNFSPIRIRFVAISATVANPEDVAAWLGTNNKPAVYYKFGDECRPVKVNRIVEGYPCPAGTSIFKFDIILNYKLWNIIQKYHNGKPTLIFCNTRKSVALTAETLSREITVGFSEEQKKKLVELAATIKNKKIQSLILCGVGCHHAGLLFEERRNIELAFRNRDVPILITTTTLAMGVNLPAHLVIIKNTQQYVNGEYREYSISTILQMVGRAGRPQYDTQATAVIMTRLQDKARYHALVGGIEPLQSYLHKRLPENLNSEAALGTVCDVQQCVQWVNSTFLSVRAARDPRRYLGLQQAAPAQLISKKIEELCVKAMNGLATAGLITMDEASCIESTEAGRLMSIYYLDVETMKLIMKLEGSESLERLLWLICESHELSDMHLRVDERRCLNALNRNNTADTIRFPMKGKISTRQMKLNCIIQAVLGCLNIPDPSLHQEAMKIMRIADRICKCLVYYVTRSSLISQKPKFYFTVLNSIILHKCLFAHLWENSPFVSRQLRGIGPSFSSSLASAGKVNFMQLEESHPRDLERIMNKGPPAGNIIRKQVNLLPKYNVTVFPIDKTTVKIQLSLLNHAHLAENMDHLTAGANHKSYIIVGDSENFLLHLTSFVDSELIHLHDGYISYEITRIHPTEHKINVHCISSTFAGIDEKCEYLFQNLNTILPTIVQIPHHLDDTPQGSSEDMSMYFKDRKRKATSKNITESNEKKKRDTNLIEKFKHLKQSFERTSKEIKVDLNKTAEISSKVLQDLAPKNIISTNEEVIINTAEDWDQSLENAFTEDFIVEDTVDDNEVSNIINKIENEIKCEKNIASSAYKKPIQTTMNLSSDSFNPNQKKIVHKSITAVNHAVKRKSLDIEKNFRFIDSLQKKNINKHDETANADSILETGFTNAVKDQIEQYLQRTHNHNKDKIDFIDLIEDFPKSQKSPKTYDKDVVKDVIIKRKYFSCELVDETDKLNNISEYNEMMIERSPLDFETINKVNTQDPVIYFDENKKIEDITISNVKKTAENIVADENNFNLLKPVKDIAIRVNDIQDKNNIEDSEKNNNYPKDSVSDSVHPQVSCSTSKNLNIKTNLDLKEISYITPLCSHQNSSSNENTKYTKNKSSILCNNPNYNFNNINYFLPNAHRSRENIEYMKKYQISETKVLNIMTETPKHKVHIVGKLNVNMDVTKIVYKNDSEKQDNYNSQMKIDDNEIQCADDISLIDENRNKIGVYRKCKVIKLRDRLDESHTNEKFETNYSNKLKITQDDNLITPTYLCDNIHHSNGNRNLELDKTKFVMNNPSVEDILQKYKYVMKELNTKNNINLNNRQNNINEKCDTKRTEIIPSKRKLRISDLDKVKVELPLALTVECQNITSQSIDYNHIQKSLDKTNKVKNDKVENYVNELTPYNNEHEMIEQIPTKLNTKSYIEIEDIEDDINSIMSPDLAEVTDFNSQVDLNHTILNPKALLQSINEDGNEIISPPSEFCDIDTYSPTSPVIHENLKNEDKVLECDDFLISQNFCEYQPQDIFIDNSAFDLTPSKEIETWTVSQNINSSIYSTPSQSFTVLHRNMAESYNSPHFINSRREKFSKFKFKPKNMLRK